MKINDNSQFPIFSISNNGEQTLYLSAFCCFTFFPNGKDLYFEFNNENIPLFVNAKEETTTKDDFRLSNIVLLKKTGLINLFKDTETQKDTIEGFEQKIELLKSVIGIRTQNMNEWKEKAEQLERVLEKAQNKIHQLGIELECNNERGYIISKMESMFIEKEKEHFEIRNNLEQENAELRKLLKRLL